jgi:hypothetical protein
MDELISAPLPNEWAQRTLEDGRAERSSEWTVGDDQLWITFRLNAPGVVARLFDASGERVRESRSGEQPAVVREVRWRVDSFAGQRVQLRLEMPHSGEKAGGMPEVTLHRRR